MILTILDESFTWLVGWAKGACTQRHILLGLWVERRILDKTVDKDANVILDLERFDVFAATSLLYCWHDSFDDLIHNMIDVYTTLGSTNGIDKADLKNKVNMMIYIQWILTLTWLNWPSLTEKLTCQRSDDSVAVSWTMAFLLSACLVSRTLVYNSAYFGNDLMGILVPLR